MKKKKSTKFGLFEVIDDQKREIVSNKYIYIFFIKFYAQQFIPLKIRRIVD